MCTEHAHVGGHEQYLWRWKPACCLLDIILKGERLPLRSGERVRGREDGRMQIHGGSCQMEHVAVREKKQA